MKASEIITAMLMAEPERTRFFIQTDKRKVKRGYMNIPARVRRILEKRKWQNKDTVWVLMAEYGDWFVTFHKYEDYLGFMRFVEIAATDKKLNAILRKGRHMMKEVEK